MNGVTIVVPMPTVSKTSNSRVHWNMRAELRRAAHLTGATLARAELRGKPSPFTKDDELTALITFCPKNRVCPDLDNCLSGIKGEIDGMFSALGINDKQLQRIELQRNYAPQSGDVVITVMSR